MPARCFRGDRAALTALRLRRIVSFLRRHRLYDTAHDLERRTGAFFDAAHFRRLLRQLRWADASSYALGFITVGHCSREADTLIVRILVLRFMADLATGRDRAADALFPRLYASLDSQSDGHFLRRVLPSLRSDRDRACTLYHRAKPMAVDVILKMAAKCPELKAKSQLPRLDPAYALSLGPGLRGFKMRRKNKAGCIPAHVLAGSFMQRRPHLVSHDMNHSVDTSRHANPLMVLRSSPVLLLHLRRLDRFLKCQGLHSAARTLERESLVYFDAVHLQRLVTDGRWEAAGNYMCRFSPLWEGEATSQHYTAFLHTLENHAMLHFLACRGDKGGRAASSLFCDDAFREKPPEMAQRHELYRSMASKQARAAVNWEAIKLTTLEKLQELLRLSPDLECSLRMRAPQCTSMPSEIVPLGLWGSQRHQRKRLNSKPARELALFLQQKRLSSSQETAHSGDSGVSSATLLQPTEDKRTYVISSSTANTGKKHLRSQDDYCTGIAQ